MEESKLWKCANGHTLGQVKRNGSGVRQLQLYRHAVDLTDEAPKDVDLIGCLEGSMFDIRCDICGAVRPWTIGKEAIKEMVEIYQPE